MELMEVIKKRRSVRKYLEKPVPEDIIHNLLEAGRLAPSGGNSQNHFFGVVREECQKGKLGRAAGNQMWIKTAPVIIAYCAYIGYDLAEVPEDDFALIVNKTRFGDDLVQYLNNYQDRKAVNTFWNNSSPLIPGEHIFLAAISYGLNACWIGYLDIKKASKILNLPDDVVCLYLMPLGYAAKEPEKKARKTLEELTFYDQWRGEIDD